jgi:molybdopterin-guanine dinucleotide biosynthesis protein A
MRLHGLLLTGGLSTRMGSDKFALEVGGMSLAARVGRALALVARPVLTIGPSGDTGFESLSDDGQGPLAAFALGAGELRARECDGPVVLAACDLPFVSAEMLVRLSAELGDADAAVPVLDGRDQPLAACYGARAGAIARDLVREGRRAMHDLLESIEVCRVPESVWTRFGSLSTLMDVDTPADLDAARRLALG